LASAKRLPFEGPGSDALDKSGFRVLNSLLSNHPNVRRWYCRAGRITVDAREKEINRLLVALIATSVAAGLLK
jgi:hypothetical protein